MLGPRTRRGEGRRDQAAAVRAARSPDPVSGRPYVDILATGVSQAPYTRSTQPFEIVKDTLYYVGDNEVALYLLHADMALGARLMTG
jgi:hypothetical protein